MEAAQQYQNGQFKFKRERNRVISKTSEEKEEKGVKKKNVIDTPCEINIFVKEHFSSENT